MKEASFWSGTTADIINAINNGAFLVTHYDHGNVDGWAHPAFKNSNITNLTNGALLPIIYSIDCLVGEFYWYNSSKEGNKTGFAEKIVRKKNGGALGIIAAQRVTYSGPNDALYHGLIDATWPGFIHKSAQTPNPTITTHKPIYIMGDILDQGLFRMTQTWPDKDNKFSGGDYGLGAEYHYVIYNYFGDPTTRMWTGIPKSVTVNIPDTIDQKATIFPVENLNVLGGIITLYDKKSGIVVGKKIVDKKSFNIAVVKPLSAIGNGVTLTVTGQNIRPFIKNIIIGTKKQEVDTIDKLKAISFTNTS
jgi:hypothetical protein